MDVSAEVVLFLGAGASLPRPAGGPLFREVRDACAKRAGVDPYRWYGRRRHERRLRLLDHVIPEVFLKELADAGYRLEEGLARAVAGTPGTGPNAVHRLAADVLRAGGQVWTTNWDTWVEEAWADTAGAWPPRAVAPDDDPADPGVGLFKLHGTADRADTLMFATPHIMRPLPQPWHGALAEAAHGRVLVVVGYGGADVDLYPALSEAVRGARLALWFEGAGDQPPEPHPLADYARWRFRLGPAVSPTDVPHSGAHLAWCGAGAAVDNPSDGCLALFGRPAADAAPSPDERFAAVDREVSGARQSGARLPSRLLLSARVRERLGRRWTAAARHVALLAVGPGDYRRRAFRSLGGLVLLRAQPLRSAANRVVAALSRDPETSEFLVAQAGGVSHDAEWAARVADGTERVSVGRALTAAQNTRWAGDLTVAERIARGQFEHALAQDLSDPLFDWPERVARSSFELGQALLWQGRLWDADDVCRSGYMRVAGAKWTAWEYALRAPVLFAADDPAGADAQFALAFELLDAEGFRDFTPTLSCGRAACARAAGHLPGARRHLQDAERAPRKGPGTTAAILAERGEQALAAGRPGDALVHLRALAASRLPLWSAAGHLRLAELGEDADANAAAALSKFTAVGSRWGAVRTGALRDDAVDVQRESAPLGPTAVFAPNGPWLL